MRYLENRQYVIVARNYRKKCGELDVVAKKDGVLHFVEVKAGSWHGPWPEEGVDQYSPLDHMHRAKRERLARIIQVYIDAHAIECTWTCDVAEVLIDPRSRKARVRLYEDVAL